MAFVNDTLVSDKQEMDDDDDDDMPKLKGLVITFHDKKSWRSRIC